VRPGAEREQGGGGERGCGGGRGGGGGSRGGRRGARGHAGPRARRGGQKPRRSPVAPLEMAKIGVWEDSLAMDMMLRAPIIREARRSPGGVQCRRCSSAGIHGGKYRAVRSVLAGKGDAAAPWRCSGQGRAGTRSLNPGRPAARQPAPAVPETQSVGRACPDTRETRDCYFLRASLPRPAHTTIAGSGTRRASSRTPEDTRSTLSHASST